MIIEFAIEVHKELGPGMLEGSYEACLQFELNRAGLKSETQLKLPISYQGMKFDAGYRIDMLVEDSVIVELKSIERLMPIHEAQLFELFKNERSQTGLIDKLQSPATAGRYSTSC